MPTNPNPKVPTGAFKTFGPIGPAYQVMDAIRPTENGDWLVEIIVLESGETLEYLLSKINKDPEA